MILNLIFSSRNVARREETQFMLSLSTSPLAMATQVGREIRCMDLGGEALGSYKARQGGCTHIQFFNQAEHLKCTGCWHGVFQSNASPECVHRDQRPPFLTPLTLGHCSHSL
ncbi:hypothetical protein DFH29DRAFT_598409 [Suillus ampliporus]|nr:hypothetical protein DFH29DRAFT_598409 [Suillus ampliporus]